jgi:hypothetical protein
LTIKSDEITSKFDILVTDKAHNVYKSPEEIYVIDTVTETQTEQVLRK